MNAKRTDKLRIRAADAIVPAAAVLAAVVLMVAAAWTPAPSARYAEVTVHGQTVAVLPLSTDTVWEWRGDDGFNRVEVSDGLVRVTTADCESQVCVHSRAVSRVGGSIVCAPHGLVVTVLGESDLSAPDLIVG